jgi:AcrR family transcriptional regulator
MTQIVEAARDLLENEGPEALTMRRVAEILGIRAASLYKHLPGKGAVENALIEIGLTEVGGAMHAALATLAPDTTPPDAVEALLSAYRAFAFAHPNLYRLATSGTVDRSALTPTLEDWAGEPFLLATGDPYVGQALWAAAHGLVILILDRSLLPGSDVARTWRAVAEAFGGLISGPTSDRTSGATGDRTRGTPPEPDRR